MQLTIIGVEQTEGREAERGRQGRLGSSVPVGVFLLKIVEIGFIFRSLEVNVMY